MLSCCVRRLRYPLAARVGAPLIAAALASCNSADSAPTVDGIFSPTEWATIQKLSPLPAVPADPTNAYADDPRAAALGQKLFFEAAFSGPLAVGNDGKNGGLGKVGEEGRVSCNVCHDPGQWFQDTRSRPPNVTLGSDWLPHRAPSLVNVGFYTWFHWTGQFDSMWAASVGGVENPASYNGSRLKLAHVLYDQYRSDYDAIFSPPLDPALDPGAPDASRFPPAGKPKASASAHDGPWEGMTAKDRTTVNRIMSNAGKALEAYVRELTSRNAPFDQYVAGDYGAISTQAKQGLELFIGKAACVACHSGPFFTDNKFHNTGVPQNLGGPHAPASDIGRFGVVAATLSNPFRTDGPFSDDTTTGKLAGLAQVPDQTGQFRTKDLRQVAAVGPYMHAGQLATLDDVVEFYNGGGGNPSTYAGKKDPLIVPLNLTSDERAAIVAFLQTLTGDPVPSSLTKESSDP